MNLILHAAKAAELAHRGQTRKYTGRPYIEHPGRVAARLSRHAAADEYMVAAAWLHDVLEDTEIEASTLAKFLPGLALDYVKALTNPSKKRPDLSRAQKKELDRDHMRTCTGDVRRIKMADRIDNLTDLMSSAMLGHAEAGSFMRTYVAESALLITAIFVPHDELTIEFKDTLATARRCLGEAA